MNNPKISFIICSKNDNWEGNPIDRLQKSIEITSKNTQNPENYEILIGDWGSDVPIHDAIKINSKIQCRVFYIPKNITKKFDTPISEVHCLNMLSRKATGQFIGRTDQDTIIHERFFKYVESELLNENELYWSGRQDLPENSLNYDDGIFHGDGLPCSDIIWRGAIGIVMMARTNWEKLTGYDEKMIYRNDMEHDLYHRAIRLCNLNNIGCKLDSPFYHIYHTRSQGLSAKHNASNWQNPSYFHSLPTKINDENYGLYNYFNSIEERVL